MDAIANQKKVASRREEIINVAEKLFASQGYEKTNVESIIQSVGMAKGSFYTYFPTKNDVLDAVLNRMADRIITRIRTILTDTRYSPKERLQYYLTYAFSLSKDWESELASILSSTHESHAKSLYEAALYRSIRIMTPVYTNLIEEGMERNEFSVQNASFTSHCIAGAFANIHLSYYESLTIDFEEANHLLQDFLSRVLGTTFESFLSTK